MTIRILVMFCLLCLTPAFAQDPPAINVAATGTVATLSWSDMSNNEDGFKIERSCTGEANFTEVGRVGPNVTTFANQLDNTVLGGKTCAYRVAAFNSAGNSAYSNVASMVVPLPPPTIPAAPTNLTVL